MDGSSQLPGYDTVRYCPAGHRQPEPGPKPAATPGRPTATFRVRRHAGKLELNGQLIEWPADQLFVRRCIALVRTDDPDTGREVRILCGQEWVESTEGSTDN